MHKHEIKKSNYWEVVSKRLKLYSFSWKYSLTESLTTNTALWKKFSVLSSRFYPETQNKWIKKCNLKRFKYTKLTFLLIPLSVGKYWKTLCFEKNLVVFSITFFPAVSSCCPSWQALGNMSSRFLETWLAHTEICFLKASILSYVKKCCSPSPA